MEKRPPFTASVLTSDGPVLSLDARMNFASVTGESHALKTFSRGAAILRLTVSSSSLIFLFL
jgi:hypothetical protein